MQPQSAQPDAAADVLLSIDCATPPRRFRANAHSLALRSSFFSLMLADDDVPLCERPKALLVVAGPAGCAEAPLAVMRLSVPDPETLGLLLPYLNGGKAEDLVSSGCAAEALEKEGVACKLLANANFLGIGEDAIEAIISNLVVPHWKRVTSSEAFQPALVDDGMLHRVLRALVDDGERFGFDSVADGSALRIILDWGTRGGKCQNFQTCKNLIAEFARLEAVAADDMVALLVDTRYSAALLDAALPPWALLRCVREVASSQASRDRCQLKTPARRLSSIPSPERRGSRD